MTEFWAGLMILIIIGMGGFSLFYIVKSIKTDFPGQAAEACRPFTYLGAFKKDKQYYIACEAEQEPGYQIKPFDLKKE